ncbi:toxic anion resistance protein [Sphingomonas parapaucimobilis]|uniref:toxic anion resistance protein n=1 Tax=Sphingomonas parapaucimobilis TaxID=28213 RepID=UPI0035C86901
MVDGEPSNSQSPVAAGTELKIAAREIVRRWVRDASDVILDRIGEGAMCASSDATAHLSALVEGRSAQTIIAHVERSIAAWDAPPPPPRFPWLRGRQQTAPGLSPKDIDTLVMRLDAERDESTRRMILLTSARDRLAKATGGLEQALTTIELLRPMIESAARELRVEQPERAAAMQDRGSAILLEREQALLTQQAIHQQAVMTLDLLIANQTVLDKAIVQTRTATLSALQVAMAARQVMSDQTRIDPGIAAESARDKLRAALAEAHQAMETLASRDNSTSPVDL